jgi:uncharacterized membrane protein
MKQMLNELSHTLKQGLKGTEPVITFFSGSYLLLLSIQKRNYPLGIAGGFLLFKAGTKMFRLFPRNTSHNGAVTAHHVDVETELIVEMPCQEVFDVWRNFENLPQFMEHLKKVEVMDEKRSTWEILLPGNMGSMSWVSELEKDDQGKEIKWKSEKGSFFETFGGIKFQELGPDKTKLQVKIAYKTPEGIMSESMGKLWIPLLEEMIVEDIHNFKKYMETHRDYFSKEKVLGDSQ